MDITIKVNREDFENIFKFVTTNTCDINFNNITFEVDNTNITVPVQKSKQKSPTALPSHIFKQIKEAKTSEEKNKILNAYYANANTHKHTSENRKSGYTHKNKKQNYNYMNGYKSLDAAISSITGKKNYEVYSCRVLLNGSVDTNFPIRFYAMSADDIKKYSKIRHSYLLDYNEHKDEYAEQEHAERSLGKSKFFQTHVSSIRVY